MKKSLLVLVGWMTCLVATSQTGSLHPVDKSSTVGFVIRNFGINTSGTFSGLEGDIVFDAAKPGQSRFNVHLSAASINTGNKKRDNHLRSDDFFHTEKYPSIQIKSESITPGTAPGSYVLKGKLTMHGETGEVEIPFTAKKDGNGWLFEGRFSVNRLNYKVGGSSATMSDEAKVTLRILAR